MWIDGLGEIEIDNFKCHQYQCICEKNIDGKRVMEKKEITLHMIRVKSGYKE
jgi:hypothetical protein